MTDIRLWGDRRGKRDEIETHLRGRGRKKQRVTRDDGLRTQGMKHKEENMGTGKGHKKHTERDTVDRHTSGT